MKNAFEHTGMPSGKTHRGKRSRGHGPKVEQHMSALTSALDAGDHKSAKSSALHLAKALHGLSKPVMQNAAIAPDPGVL